MRKEDLPKILEDCLKSKGGKATILGVCKYIWDNYHIELKNSGDLFYTWQYDIRWAATKLRKDGKMRSKEISPRGLWELK